MRDQSHSIAAMIIEMAMIVTMAHRNVCVWVMCVFGPIQQ